MADVAKMSLAVIGAGAWGTVLALSGPNFASPESRHRRAGERLVRGTDLAELERSQTTEGLRTVRALVAYAAREGLELPIARAVYEVIYGGKVAARALSELMARELKAEW